MGAYFKGRTRSWLFASNSTPQQSKGTQLPLISLKIEGKKEYCCCVVQWIEVKKARHHQTCKLELNEQKWHKKKGRTYGCSCCFWVLATGRRWGFMAARFCRKEREEVASRLHRNHEEIEEGGVFEEKMITWNVKDKIWFYFILFYFFLFWVSSI